MAGSFSTRVIVLMPVAIAINIVLGFTVQQVLKLPIYLDSIGTILVGVLAGPIAGALTGILSNLIWQYAPGIGGGTIGPFAIVAGIIGLLAGLWGYLGGYRRRRATGPNLGGPVGVAFGFILFLGQGCSSDPIDKVITSFVVFIILAGLSQRLVARFPLGERSVGAETA